MEGGVGSLVHMSRYTMKESTINNSLSFMEGGVGSWIRYEQAHHARLNNKNSLSFMEEDVGSLAEQAHHES
jgi:hypothetical protein